MNLPIPAVTRSLRAKLLLPLVGGLTAGLSLWLIYAGSSTLSLILTLWLGGLALLVYLRVDRLVLRPVAAIADTLQQWAAGDHAARALVTGDDEMATLAATLNRVLSAQDAAEQHQVRRDHKSRALIEQLTAQTVAHARDIAEHRQTEAALQEREQRFQTLFEYGPDAAYIVDMQSRFLEVNLQARRELGYSREELLQLRVADVDPDFRGRDAEEQFWQTPEQQQPVSFETTHRRQDGSRFPVELRLGAIELDGRRCLFGFARNLSERRAAEQRIDYLAWHDPLTGLPNPILARDRLQQALAHAAREHSQVALLLLDLDRFKLVNESLGRGYGDRLLQAIARRLQETLRDADTVSRHGGDEFLILAIGLDNAEVVGRVAQKLLDTLAASFGLDGHELTITTSIGVSLFPDDGSDYETLLRKAETALRHAKDGGRNLYRFFNEQMNVNALGRLVLENRLRQALERDELRLHYQPLVELATGRIVGAEALLRWQSAELGMIAPAHFIPVAEESGLIVPIGVWVLREACRQAQAWRNEGLPALTMAVNISVVQFKRADMVNTVAQALAESGLNPGALELELTESVLIQDVDAALYTVRRLKDMGVRLAIDDFGTGYSSMSYLRRLAVDQLKIDQSFVRELSEDPEDAAIVRAIIQLGRTLRLTTLAEGVETAEQAAFLRREGCELAQGYYFGRPGPPELFTDGFNPPAAASCRTGD